MGVNVTSMSMCPNQLTGTNLDDSFMPPICKPTKIPSNWNAACVGPNADTVAQPMVICIKTDGVSAGNFDMTVHSEYRLLNIVWSKFCGRSLLVSASASVCLSAGSNPGGSK